jgi:hypothetical protein
MSVGIECATITATEFAIEAQPGADRLTEMRRQLLDPEASRSA